MTKEPWVGTLGRGAVVSRVLVSQNYDSRITTRPTRTLDEPNADSKHKELVILPKKKAWFTCDLLSVPFLFSYMVHLRLTLSPVPILFIYQEAE
jgi:hypothetical protein